MKIRWTPRALADLDGIRRYISGDSPRAASEVVRRVRAAVDILKTHPEAGRSGRLEGTRELVAAGTSYIVPYRFVSNGVELLAVMHGAQEWPEHFWSGDEPPGKG